MTLILSVDVEDWFHILDLDAGPPMSEWGDLPSRVEHNFLALLDVFDRHAVSATCFFLGWTAEHFPHLVREAVGRGHEIASHSYSHRLVYALKPEEFTEDTRLARALLQDLSGQDVKGYRAPGFSVTQQTPWFFDSLANVGHTYDTSVFPSSRGHGGLPGADRFPSTMCVNGHSVTEIPVSVAQFGKFRMCFFGGGYFRLYPYDLIRRAARRLEKEGLPVVFYLHPRDIDPDQPRLPMSPARRFKSYVNLGTTTEKLHRLLSDFQAVPFRDFLQQPHL